MTDTKPEALRLAEKLPKYWHANLATDRDIDQVVAELRRLHEQNEALCAANEDTLNHFNTLMADHKKLQVLNAELVEALKEIADWTDRYTTPGHPISTVARAAIAKAEGSV